MQEIRENEVRLIPTSSVAQRVLDEANSKLDTTFTLKDRIQDLPVDVFAELLFRINAHSFVQCSPNR